MVYIKTNSFDHFYYEYQYLVPLTMVPRNTRYTHITQTSHIVCAFCSAAQTTHVYILRRHIQRVVACTVEISHAAR